MSDILCRWLNEELRLSKAVDPKTLASDFSNGYLIGEVLHKYQLQNDFSMFTKKDTSISRLNNFTRVEPTLQLLGISFDINTAQELMQEKQDVALCLLHQLYSSLEEKKAEISGTLTELMQPAANVGLLKKEHEISSDRLHHVVQSDGGLKLQNISQHHEEKCQQLNDGLVMTLSIQQKRQLQNEKRLKNIKELKVYRQKHNDIRILNQATIIKVPKPPPYTSQLHLKRRQQQQQRREQEVQKVQTEITQFETRKKLLHYNLASLSSGQPPFGEFTVGGTSQGFEVPGSGAKQALQSNSKYTQDIRQRLEEKAVASEQKEKRQDRFLVEQLEAQEAQQEAQREEQLVKRLTRPTQQEQRFATQLLQIRVQKDVIRNNRLFREQQHQQRRERDFQENLEREAALAQQAIVDRAEEISKELESCNRIAAEQAQARFKKHSQTCRDILDQMVDLATKVGEYRLHTGNLIPEKPMREWKELLFSGLPLYEPVKCQQPKSELSAPLLDPVELKKQEILKSQDYEEYTNMVGEWAWPEEAGESNLPLTNNNVLGHVVQRLRNIVRQPIVEPPPPSFPDFTIKACVLGKFCSGKTTCLDKLAENLGIHVLSADSVIAEALNAYHNGEEVTEPHEEKDRQPLLTSSTSLNTDVDTQDESRDSNPSIRAMQGAAAEKVLREGNAIPNELMVDIMVEAIRQVPAQSGWILDGFPLDITGAHLLEKALGGSVDEVDGVVSSRTELATDPNPPEPTPPLSPVLDLALLLDAPDECVIRRSFSHTDNNMYLAQISDRITAFQDTRPKLEKWFGGRQNILVRVDADVDEEELHKEVESVLQRVMAQTQEALTAPPSDDVVLDSVRKAPECSCSAIHSPADHVQGHTSEAYAESHISLDDEKAKSVTSLFKSNAQVLSRSGSTSSVANEDSQEVPPRPGSPGWVYVDEPVAQELSESLCSHWDTVCDSYAINSKTVMHHLRSQRSMIELHLFNIREEYKHFLGRPDLKQELVSHWQKDFNSIPDDIREDDDTKAELHLRLNELCQRLLDISKKHKEEDEKERARVMGDGWLEKHTIVLVNYHSVLIQVEMDRFQDTFRILKVYYLGMHRDVLPELPSKLDFIPLLHYTDVKQQGESPEPTARSVSRQTDDGEDKKKTKRRPDSKTKNRAHAESVKLPHEKLICDYEEALSAITKLVSAEAHQGETKEPKERDKKVRENIHQEYAAALEHEGNAAMARIALVKGHGLVMVQSLQSRAAQTSSSMEKWLEAHYLAERKSINQLSEVVGHHIEEGAKLQYQLIMEGTDFYLNGDCHMFTSPAPPPRPPPLEKPTRSTPTITQLAALHRQLCIVAPSGLISSFHFLELLVDIISVNMGRNTLPEPWMNMNETQLLEIVSLLAAYELIDWRQFLLSAALPWPFPSLSQLLVVRQRFKAADTGDTGYVNEDQYLQTKLWFSNDRVQPVPEDPSEPLPYDRLGNLRKFFFQLFADRSFSPPQLDYVYMLQYFAADPNPRQGFIRALSVVMGEHLTHSSLDDLVKSMPSIDKAAELGSSELDGDYEGEDTLCAWNGSSGEQEVSIPALLAVTCHKVTHLRDGSPLLPGCLSEEERTEQLVHLFIELGYEPGDCVPFSILSQHPFIQSLMETSTQYQFVNIHGVLLGNQDEMPDG
ncbi:sperm flagellar protein 2 [Clinocottus analis]|uniref:sperm flagellar protein 2 n=1 Tax=Clinocottus analis TaxID=304258 RepID=UPI0035BFEDE7